MPKRPSRRRREEKKIDEEHDIFRYAQAKKKEAELTVSMKMGALA